MLIVILVFISGLFFLSAAYRHLRQPLEAFNYVSPTAWIADTERATQKQRKWARIMGIAYAYVGLVFILGGLVVVFLFT